MLNRPLIIYTTAALFGLLLSLTSAWQLSVINPDAICYLQSAQAATQGIHALMNTCDQARWPFYSLVIYATKQITHLSFFTSAMILDSFFSLVSLLAFISIIQCLARNKASMMWLAALVFLLAHEFNGLRSDIIRDHGFWAFYLISISSLLHYFRDLRWLLAITWSVSLVIATLFRIEGIFFLVLLPLIAWFDTQTTLIVRAKNFLKLNFLTLVGLFFLCIWMVLHPSQDLSRLQEVKHHTIHIWYDVANSLTKRAHLLAQYVLTPQAERDSYITLLLTFLSSYSLQIIENLSLVYTILVGYAWYRSALTVQRQLHWVLWGYVIVNLIVTMGFFLEYLFLSKRYLIALSLILMVWVPFALHDLIQRWRQRKLLLALLAALLLFSSIGGIIHFGYSKAYIHDAGDWLAANVPANASLYSNDIQLMYYSNHYGDQIFVKFKDFSTAPIAEPKIQHEFDYLALHIKKNQVANFVGIQDTPVKIFSNKRGDEVAIYKIK